MSKLLCRVQEPTMVVLHVQCLKSQLGHHTVVVEPITALVWSRDYHSHFEFIVVVAQGTRAWHGYHFGLWELILVAVHSARSDLDWRMGALIAHSGCSVRPRRSLQLLCGARGPIMVAVWVPRAGHVCLYGVLKPIMVAVWGTRAHYDGCCSGHESPLWRCCLGHDSPLRWFYGAWQPITMVLWGTESPNHCLLKLWAHHRGYTRPKSVSCLYTDLQQCMARGVRRGGSCCPKTLRENCLRRIFRS